MSDNIARKNYPEALSQPIALFKDWRRKSINSTWVSIEIEKVVAMMYFAIIVILFAISLGSNPNIVQTYGIFFQSSGDFSSPISLIVMAVIVVLVAVVPIVLVIIISIRNLLYYTRDVSAYLMAIDMHFQDKEEKN